MERFTPLKLPINEVFNTIKNQPGSGTQDQSNTIPRFPAWRNIVPIMIAKSIKPSTVEPFKGT